MLKVLMALLKITVFAAIVVVLANVIKWDGKTISDQVKTGLAHAERESTTTVNKVKNWAGSVTNPKASHEQKGARPHMAIAPVKKKFSTSDGITESEREKLRTLMRQLNSTHPDTEARR
jgi:hypothetical protein